MTFIEITEWTVFTMVFAVVSPSVDGRLAEFKVQEGLAQARFDLFGYECLAECPVDC